ncbi:Cu(I)-responsive transcriptional regulator [Vibrio sp. V27_P1S3P104]|uniref:Cu(I)-responsive transcriptional regulator n=1 Tax=unclassified Vibrio TaxID=2614977 RepID=UPI0013735426|nr:MULTISPECIES: Cu(I)-responsive transcriptional regulator [unclassified Vibrio]NAW69416.1 Cu(I)-responsive transcriptional regulator [Vibrio sp. V28_P6S34P95]NAX05440.1 Cu(I)-responsive transcriptional regulator [Vibrio sp. V30_P3S12P165]NAX35331.1 Cu(I)-responsive transcriptional regulator [Vibrio sp. V29_P1S30P107]NAX36233.1 Cu(I)-responsive transcriptional regulator [Vibrio sp. V27_P1S3P104]NAX39560.1 Cu(I)-responsive transcriptional regulator [Vibrio sp. V26_P1S5P106]
MQIRDVAKITGLSAKSIRFYEFKGLIAAAERGSNGYRYYSEHHLAQLRLIASARQVGFSLDECASLLQLAQKEDRTSAEIKKKTQRKVQDIESKIAQLEQIKAQLQSWISECPGDSGPACPILDNLYHYPAAQKSCGMKKS